VIPVTEDSDSCVCFVKKYEPLLTNWLQPRRVPKFVNPDVPSEGHGKLIVHFSMFGRSTLAADSKSPVFV